MKGTTIMIGQAIPVAVARFDPRQDQVTATRCTLKQMNDAADRAIDEQVARSTPMAPKK
jgi:hypothetical protein